MGYVDYDISWTMPQCVLCLRLIGVAIDVYDGGRPKDKLSKNEAAQGQYSMEKHEVHFVSHARSFPPSDQWKSAPTGLCT